ncbi:MAG: SGNH/GDSL hydrolase family protein [Geminicoccaceae bacterium]
MMIAKGFRLALVAAMFSGTMGRAEAFEIFDSLWVTGDSLSDDGNFWGNCTPNTEPPGGPGLYLEGRYSDGPMWVEHLAEIAGLDTGDEDEYVNLAYAGAYANEFNRNLPPDLLTASCSGRTGVLAQADEVAASVPDKDALVTVLVGANDYFAWLQQGDPTVLAPMRCVQEGISPVDGDGNVVPAQIGACTALVVNDIASTIVTLHRVGVKHFIVGNLPRLGDTPGGKGQGADVANLLNGITETHNRTLEVAVERLRQDLGGARITLLDVSALFSGFLSDPADFGLANVDIPCLVPGENGIRQPTGACVDGSSTGTLFFDPIHPTAGAHKLTSVFAAASLAADTVFSDRLRDRQEKVNDFALRIVRTYVKNGRLPLHMVLRRWGLAKR